MNFFSSGTQIRCWCRFGANKRGTILVTCRPTPPFFLAIPRRRMMLPRMGFDPVMVQTFDMVLKRGRKRCRAVVDCQAIYSRRLSELFEQRLNKSVKLYSRNR